MRLTVLSLNLTLSSAEFKVQNSSMALKTWHGKRAVSQPSLRYHDLFRDAHRSRCCRQY